MTNPVDTDALQETASDLRGAVIQNAPHAEHCGYIKGDNEWIEVERCTCWKADAL